MVLTKWLGGTASSTCPTRAILSVKPCCVNPSSGACDVWHSAPRVLCGFCSCALRYSTCIMVVRRRATSMTGSVELAAHEKQHIMGDDVDDDLENK